MHVPRSTDSTKHQKKLCLQSCGTTQYHTLSRHPPRETDRDSTLATVTTTVYN